MRRTAQRSSDTVPARPNRTGWLWLTLASTALLHGNETTTPPDWVAQVDDLFASHWIAEGELRVSGGWTSNALLASSTPTDTGFSREEVEASLLRASLDGPWQFFTILTGDETQFFDAPEAPSSRSWFWHVGGRWNPPKSPWNLGASVQAYHQRQVLDLSENAAEPLVARLGLQGVSTQVSGRYGYERGAYVELSADLTRQDFQGAPEDADETAGTLRTGWKTAAFELAVSGGQRHRRYDHRAPYSVIGRPLTGQILMLNTREGALHGITRARWFGEWELRADASRARVNDNRSGWFDSRHDEGHASLEWSRHPWLVRCDGSLGHTKNIRQYVVRGGVAAPRERRDRMGLVEIDHTLPRGWLLFARAERTLSTSNDPRLTYAVNAVSAGLGWKF